MPPTGPPRVQTFFSLRRELSVSMFFGVNRAETTRRRVRVPASGTLERRMGTVLWRSLEHQHRHQLRA